MLLQVTDYLDHRNRPLWDELSSEYTVTVKMTEDNNYGIYIRNKFAEISVPAQPVCIDSFTHELLHLHIDQKGVRIGPSLQLLSQADKLLSFIPQDLWSHAGNCLEHVKMLPRYLQMGFDRRKFLYDYDLYKGAKAELGYISAYMASAGNPWKIASHLFLGRYFSMKACPNDAFDYTVPMAILEQADSELYQVCETLWLDWEKYDYTNDGVFNSYRSVSFDFIEALGKWAEKRIEQGLAD